ncbi:MAG TPA: SusC/RagA family TonB-linked outer membrane protein, partial [Flavisolibacter sp.]|nr:SusC/RagA family TonB-linked outer membrane protein [Flavisolibacter sp.]
MNRTLLQRRRRSNACLLTTVHYTKLIFPLLLAFSLHAGARGGAPKSFTLNMRNAGVEDVIRQLQKQSGYRFFYNSGQVRTLNRVTVSVQNESLENILKKILGDRFIFRITEDDRVLISSGEVQDVIRVEGVVTDESGAPVSNVSVQVKGSSKGAKSDASGRYALDVDDNATLVFSFVGYVTEEVAVQKRTTINVQLKLASSSMDQVVVIGYGTVKKRDVTGSVSQVKVGELQKAPVASFEEALGGRVAGVRVTSSDGQPGSSINVVIRGANSVTQDNSPLYVIDGFPMESPDNYALNPAEIESIEVLKDASSTAIYGARGANGVIIITTKKGKIGAPVINYNMYYGQMKNIKKMELMNAYEFVRYQIERDSTNAYDTYLSNGKSLEDFRNEQSIDLQDQVFRTSPFQNHFISLSGGKGDTRYSISGSYLNQDGVIKNSGFDRYQGRVNIDQVVSKNFKAGINTNYSSSSRFGTVPAEQSTGFFYGNLLYSVWAYRPASGRIVLDPIQDQDDDFLTLAGFNPVKTVENEHRSTQSDLLTSNAYAEYSFGKHLKLRVTGGITRTKSRREVFNNSQTRSGSPLTTTGQNNGVNGSLTYNELTSLLNENTLNYRRTLAKDHVIDALAGFTAQKTKSSSYGAAANHIPNEALGVAGIDEGQPIRITSTRSVFTLASFLGRLNYSYRSKYLFTASLRADGSSKFSSDNKWSYFPSG